MPSTLNVKLMADGEPIGYGLPAKARIRVSFFDEPVEDAKFNHYTDEAGAVSIENMPDGAFTIYPIAEGYLGVPVRVTLPLPNEHQEVIVMVNDGATPPTPGPSGPLTRLRASETDFVNAHAELVNLRGATFFPAYEIFLDFGADALKPALAQLRDLGCNMIRVFGMSHYIQVNEFGRPAFNPNNYGDRYYDNIPAFCRFAASYGMYVYWSVFPDAGIVMPNPTRQIAHYTRVVAKLSGEPNTLVELTNEPNAHSFNAVDVSLFAKPTQILGCSGSYGDEFGGNLPPWPTWDFGDLHTPRSYPKQVKDGCTMDHPIYVQLRRPVGVGEPDRFGSQGNPDARQAAAAAGAAMLSPFWVFHSTNGKRCEVFDAVTLPCARAAFAVMVACD